MKKLQYKVFESLPHYDFESSPGMALLASVSGKEVARLEMGKACLEHNVPFTCATVSHTASITKQLTAYLVALLEDEQLLNSSDRVADLLGEFPECGSDIRISHLIHHTSGLRDQWDLLLMAGWRLDDVITDDHIWKLLITQESLNFRPGTEFLYSNSGYFVLAKVLEKLTRKTFEELLHERVSVPLGLVNTFALVDHRTIVKNRAYGYRLRSEEQPCFSRNDVNFSTKGATSLFSNVFELLRWAEFRNSLHNSPLGLRLETPGRLNDGMAFDYAYGVRVESSDDSVIYHDGWDAGYRSAVVQIPSKELAVVILANGLEISAMQIAFDTVEEVLGTDAFRPEKLLKKPTPSSTLSVQLDIEAASSFTGRYRSHELSTEYLVELNDGRLQLSHSRHPTAEIKPVGSRSFSGPNWMPYITFDESSEGCVRGMDVKSGRVRRVYFKKVASE